VCLNRSLTRGTGRKKERKKEKKARKQARNRQISSGSKSCSFLFPNLRVWIVQLWGGVFKETKKNPYQSRRILFCSLVVVVA
jgi:hypothetical protein